MAVTKPQAVKTPKISSVDIVSWSNALDERGDYIAQPNSWSKGTNVMLNSAGLATIAPGQVPWLPDTVGTVYEIFPVYYNSEMYYFVADDSKIKYCQTNDTSWTDCGGTDNSCTTTAGVINTFIRVQDSLIVTNGTDKHFIVDLATLDVIKYVKVNDPTTAPTIAGTGITVGSGTNNIYYAISYNGVMGETNLTPILSSQISKGRPNWATDGSEYITVTNPNTAPTGAKSWNLYMALAATGTTIAVTDMQLLQAKLDLSTTTFVDNGTIPIDIGANPAPQDNSTEGIPAKYAIEAEGRPVLYGITGDEYAIRIGGIGDNALSFAVSEGGYRLVVNDGSNYFPTSIVGFRSGSGDPALTLLSTSTEGIAKQFILQQNTLTYGNSQFVVWGATEQNYGAGAVGSPYATVNLMGSLIFPTDGGFTSISTEASHQNVLTTKLISQRLEKTYNSIRTDQLYKTVGCVAGAKAYLTMPTRGYAYNNQIVVLDTTNENNPVFYTIDKKAQWIGSVSPSDKSSFVYICQDNHIFKLQEGYVNFDQDSNGKQTTFPVSITSQQVAVTPAHNSVFAVSQARFDLREYIGSVTCILEYTTSDGDTQVESINDIMGAYVPSTAGTWEDGGYLYSVGDSLYQEWDDILPIDTTSASVKGARRISLPLYGALIVEAKATISTNSSIPTSFVCKGVSLEGVGVGVAGDLV